MNHIHKQSNQSYNELLQQLPKDCPPYNSKNLEGFVEDCCYYLKNDVPELDYIKVTKHGNDACPMLVVNCYVKDNNAEINSIVQNVYSVWRQYLALENTWDTIEQRIDNNNTVAELSFLTHHTMYITGRIVIYFNQTVSTP